jgi:hypothetical protein
MLITLQFAFRVREFHRRGLTVERIADRLEASIDDVMEAHRVLDLPLNDTDKPVDYRSDAQREAEFDRLPLRQQKRMRDAGRH